MQTWQNVAAVGGPKRWRDLKTIFVPPAKTSLRGPGIWAIGHSL